MSVSVGISIFSALLSMAALFVTYNVSVATQRSFVSVKEFQTFVLNNQLVVMPKWQNTGSTPTRGMVNYVNWKSVVGSLPDDFNFPDLDEQGNSTNSPKTISTYIGPKGELFAERLYIPGEILDAARQGQVNIYIWGWATYKDVFWLTSTRQTRFCHRIAVTGLEVDPATKAVSAGLAFPQHKSHNCIDGDCN